MTSWNNVLAPIRRQETSLGLLKSVPRYKHLHQDVQSRAWSKKQQKTLKQSKRFHKKDRIFCIVLVTNGMHTGRSWVYLYNFLYLWICWLQSELNLRLAEWSMMVALWNGVISFPICILHQPIFHQTAVHVSSLFFLNPFLSSHVQSPLLSYTSK